jgi:selenocysteine lyase/cysteine desulfurase
MLHSHYKVEVPIKTIQSTLYVRISAHIYNTVDDYMVLAAAIKELQQQQQQQLH